MSKWKGNAFTLVELLVVVAIIALLVAVIFPGLGRAREHAYAAICKSNLHQLHEALQVAGSESDSLYVPAPEVWVGTVRQRRAGSVLRCPKDEFLDEGADLADMVAVQYHYKEEYHHGSPQEQSWEYPMEDMLAGVAMFQLTVTEISPDVKQFNWAGHSILQVTMGSEIELRSLMGPGRASCISEMHIYYRGELVMRLTGQYYEKIDPPFYLTGEKVSYAINARVGVLPARPDQMFLVEYEKTIARQADDLNRWLGKGRHFGNQVNIICVDGRCRTVEDWELEPTDQGLWVK